MFHVGSTSGQRTSPSLALLWIAKDVFAPLRGAGGVPHSDSCCKRLTEEIAQGDEGNRVQRARQRELEFYEKAIRDTDEGGTKRKNEEHDLDQREAKRRNEEVPIMRDVDDEGRGQKRPAEGSADESRDTNETEGDVQMDLVDISFAAYEEYGGLRMVACREPEEDMRESDEQFQEEDEGGEDWRAGGGFKDDRTGKALDPTKVRAAREEGLKELDRRVWVEADVKECWDKKGRAPIGVRWVDVDKGFDVYRSRLVAKDFRPRSRVNDKEGLFAATPPLEFVKMVTRWAARNNNGGRRRNVMFVDISKAHLYAPVQEEEYVDLPPEKAQAGKFARLLYTLYGMRTAASNWEREYSGALEDAGFAVGRATSCAFYHPGRDVRIFVHGDDFVVEGEEEDLEWVRSVLEAKIHREGKRYHGP